MIVDASSLRADDLPSFDVLIVGAGAAGITLAMALSGTGLRIGVFESGGVGHDPERQALADAESCGHSYFPVVATRARRFGGSTAWWDGECRPLDVDEDLAARPWLGDPGWPLPASELLGHYPQAQQLCGFGTAPFDPAQPWLAAAGHAALPLDSRRFVTRMFRYAPVLDFAAAYGARLRDRADVTVVLGAHVIAVALSDDGSRATGVEFARHDRQRLRLDAALVVLATGGIENARLLLVSAPGGVGNRHDQVGRYFMEHVFLDDVATLRPSRRLADLRAYFRRFSHDGQQLKAALAPTAALMAAEGLPNFAIKLASRVKRRPGLVAMLGWRDRIRSGRPGPDLGAAARALLADLPGTALDLALLAAGREAGSDRHPLPLLLSLVHEQPPDPASRVTLSARRDRHGQPLARLDWQLGRLDRSVVWHGLTLLAAETARAGLGRVMLPDPPARERAVAGLRGGRHHMGTTRMSVRPEDGVVDPDGRVHGVANLFVAGSSVFPTGGHANPTLTILALTLRLAAHIRQHGHALIGMG